MTSEFIPNSYPQSVEKGFYTHTAPSNIALVKYWGKKENQIPTNTSVSFTLSNCYTHTSVEIAPREDNTSEYDFEFYFEGELKQSFHPKIITFFQRVEPYLLFLKKFHFVIRSQNSFPHSSGIASSASSMAALSVCLMKIEKDFVPDMTDDFFWKKASFLARLGSGSACRSLQKGLVVWGQHPDIDQSSDLYGISYPYKVHPVFEQYQDTILLIDQGQKQVSSSQGHNLMHGHVFAQQRFVQANQNMTELISIFEKGEIDKFVQIVESEALTLHAMMMTSLPYFILMKPQTLQVIEKIWAYRKQTLIPVCFTLDAGANVHVLYPYAYKQQVLQFIQDQLSVFCQNGKYICDEVIF